MATLDMVTPNTTVSNPSRDEPLRSKSEGMHCPPMSHQNSGDHGHEMHPQQFVRLIGCHDTPALGLHKRQDEKLH